MYSSDIISIDVLLIDEKINFNLAYDMAFMMKVGWGPIKKKDELWAQVLRSKYGYGLIEIPTVVKKERLL